MENAIQHGLLSFYKERYKQRRSMKITDLAKISDGWENEVYSFALEYEAGDEKRRESLILRIYPGDGALRKAAREFNGMKKLHEMGFPVPEVLILELDESCFGKPFVIMEKINGRSMWKAIDRSHGEERQKLITLFCEMFVDLHALDWRPFASDPSVYETGDPYTYPENWLSYAQSYLARFQIDGFIPVLSWLRERILDVPCKRFSVIHFDYHPNNILIRDDGRAFVIDWTNIDIGDFRMDLAWTILLVSTYGYPEARQIVLDEYERIAGVRIERMEYFQVVACLRRLFSILVTINVGSEKLGMRPEAATSIKQNVSHIKQVYALMCETTAISIPEVETLISTLS